MFVYVKNTKKPYSLEAKISENLFMFFDNEKGNIEGQQGSVLKAVELLTVILRQTN